MAPRGRRTTKQKKHAVTWNKNHEEADVLEEDEEEEEEEEEGVSRVEVNQRNLIDKILARYASERAVYRELLQNSNDAEATMAEIYFSVDDDKKPKNQKNDSSSSKGHMVTEVRYRNNGKIMREQDWTRLQKIAEGNPDVSKVGAFGVGAYTMFSICEEPLIVSGSKAMAFVWKGDTLWTRMASTAHNATRDVHEWTTFCLPSREAYPIPDLVEFGKFLCASLAFTQSLRKIRVYVNDRKRLVISKESVEEPQLVDPYTASQVDWKTERAVATTTQGIFSLLDGIYPSRARVRVHLDGQEATTDASYVRAQAVSWVPPTMVSRMERVSQKPPPHKVTLQLVMGVESRNEEKEGATGNQQDKATKARARAIAAGLLPTQEERGRIFIGFRTGQTTGLGLHLAAPLIPTVEREAIDFQDPTLRLYNTELLEMCGIVMRLTLEHTMHRIGVAWIENASQGSAVLVDSTLKETEESKTMATSTSQESEELVSSKAIKRPNPSVGKRIKIIRRLFACWCKQADLTGNDASTPHIDCREETKDVDEPLLFEERDAVRTVKAFCPKQSTPDELVGTVLAQGFSRCLPKTSPPVLTSNGVVRGHEGKLPNSGMEQFLPGLNLISSSVYDSAAEYHDVLAGSKPLTVDDLLDSMAKQAPMDQQQVGKFVRWWFEFISKASEHAFRGPELKRLIKINDDETPHVLALDGFAYFCDEKSMPHSVPLPETVLPKELQGHIGIQTLRHQDKHHPWFTELPMDVWVDFLSDHSCMSGARLEDEGVRLLVWKKLGQTWLQMSEEEKNKFGRRLNMLFAEKSCLPCEVVDPALGCTRKPAELYLRGAKLNTINETKGVSFPRVSSAMEVTDAFLRALGVRESVSVDFLMSTLETNRWSDDPKALVKFLRSSKLAKGELDKLRKCRFLCAEGFNEERFSPEELCFPNPDLFSLPFVKWLKWPEHLSPRSSSGKFLRKLGVSTNPSLDKLLRYLSESELCVVTRRQCLDYLVHNLGEDGAFTKEYEAMMETELKERCFLPVVTRDVLDPECRSTQLQSPLRCYSDVACGVMGFPILDPDFESDDIDLYCSRFRSPDKPEPASLIKQLTSLIASTKCRLSALLDQNTTQSMNLSVIMAFDAIFAYLSRRSDELDEALIAELKPIKFIPRLQGTEVVWLGCSEVYFRSDDDAPRAYDSLFSSIEFSPFLSVVGVPANVTTEDLFRLVLKDPQEVLEKVGSHETYESLLGILASNPPFQGSPSEVRESPFLLAYQTSIGEDGTKRYTYRLAKAAEIFIVDNDTLGRLFSVLHAPHGSVLEDFYLGLGSPFLSTHVKTDYQVVVKSRFFNTALTHALRKRIDQRAPLLVSPTVTSSQFVPDAIELLDPERLFIFQATELTEVRTLLLDSRPYTDSVPQQQQQSRSVSCCIKPFADNGSKKHALYVSSDEFDTIDWLEVGEAVADLILKRCRVADTFFFGQLLQAPWDQLRSQGFPVDRVVSQKRAVDVTPSDDCGNGATSVHPDGRVCSDSAQLEEVISDAQRMSPKDRSSQRMLSSHQSLQNRLRESIAQSGTAEASGLQSQTRVTTASLTDAAYLDSSGCEILPASSLEPFHDPSRPSSLGIAVFSTSSTNSKGFLQEHYKAVIQFSVVLGNLCGLVYGMDLSSIAIFHWDNDDDKGKGSASPFVVAFNKAGALYFNVHRFYALHYNNNGDNNSDNTGSNQKNEGTLGTECYCYWYTVIAHELAHRLVTGHTLQHGFYTEALATMYLPKLQSLLQP